MRTRSAGGIVLGDHDTIALVRHTRGDAWTFPKGHVDPGETDETAARREIMEEAGLSDLEYLDDLGSYERRRLSLDGATEEMEAKIKEIHMFLFAAPIGAVPRAHNEIAEAIWVPYREVGRKLTNDKDRNWYASVAARVREALRRD